MSNFHDRLEDRLAISDKLYRWCRAVDRRDWDAIDGCFHEDATDAHGIYNGDIPGLKAWLRERHQSIPYSGHMISNIVIDFAGPDLAVAESYVTAYQRYAKSGPTSAKTRADITGGAASDDLGDFDMLVNGRYIDIFERRMGDWRIKERTTVFDNSMMFPVSKDGPRLDPSWPVGRRDGNDPLYAALKKAGID